MKLSDLLKEMGDLEICELNLCESTQLGLRPDLIYKFKVDRTCADCLRMEKENIPPTLEQILSNKSESNNS